MILALISVGVALVILGVGAPIFFKNIAGDPDYGREMAILFRRMFLFLAPAIAAMTLAVGYKNLRWLWIVAIALLIAGPVYVRTAISRANRD